jgi:hypothetical protein
MHSLTTEPESALMKWFGGGSDETTSPMDQSSDSGRSADKADPRRRESLPLQRLWLRSLSLCIFAGAVVVVSFGLRFPNASLGVASLLAGGCLLAGGLLGFLFGVPRSARVAERPPAKPEDSNTAATETAPADQGWSAYRPNTNLEEVSDWLTKILVGVGLTQLIKAPAKAVAFGAYFGPALGGGAVGERFAICVLLYFSVSGFLIAYLWTRLYLGGALAGADAEALARVERKLDAQQLQAQRDVAAIAAIGQQLQRQSGPQEIPAERLKKVIADASDSIRAQLFYQAAGQRAANWADQSTKVVMERTIPVFEALIASDVEKRYHENWGQLGFALKDQRAPDWKRALEVLSTAIRMRGDAETHGYWLYEFNRALCRINTDENFLNNKRSTPQAAKDIRADLEVVRAVGHEDMFERAPEIEQWLELNS